MNEINEKNVKKSAPWIIIGVVVLALVALGAFYVNQNGVPRSESRIGQILEKPSDFAGQEVTVSGEVERVIGTRALTIDAPSVFSNKLLVISRNPLEPIGGSGLDALYSENDRVRVQGTVREFNLREFERILGEDLVDEEFVGWEGRPVIVADTVEENR